MSMIQSDLLLGQEGGAGYAVERSLRFNSSDSAYLSRTPASAGNRKTWTWAGWVKKSGNASFQTLFANAVGSTNTTYFVLSLGRSADDPLYVSLWDTNLLVTTQVFRDPSAWYHIVLAFDATQGTNTNRLKLYVNGSEVTTFATDNRSSISNQDYAINATESHTIGSNRGSNYLNGYLADVHFIDGQALDPTSFTEVDATTGQLIPKQYTGSFGTNGFWLKFSDNSAATATTLGKDYSGNSNNWTPNNLSVTAGAGNDSLTDSPTSYGTDTGAGGEVRGNYATLNPLENGGLTLSNGNLDASRAGGGSWVTVRSTIGISSGKYYWEFTSTVSHVPSGPNQTIGISRSAFPINTYLGSNSDSWSYFQNTGNKWTNNSGSSYGSSWASGDVIGVAFDADNGTLTFYKNNVSQGTAFTGLTAGPYFPSVAMENGSAGVFNFGQRPFAYAAPSGFKALCDTNLPAPVVAKSSDYFQTVLYTGNGGSKTVGGLSFSPDLVWIKGRSVGYGHRVFDTVRGTGTLLYTNSTDAAVSQPNANDNFASFDSGGFSLGAGIGLNENNATYVAWTWDAGSSTVTNTQGSITSSCRTNQSSGFSIVSWTGNGSTGATVGHGLGVTPGLIILKNRDDSTYQWPVWHSYYGTSTTSKLVLSRTDSTITGDTNGYVTSINSTTFGFGGGTAAVNANGQRVIAYVFSPVAGYSAMGSYVGNGSSDGVFQWCGFRPRWIMIKSSTLADGWQLFDTARGSYNVIRELLEANNSGAENTALDEIDVLSNGFKQRNTRNALNASGQTYVWVAFAESPFQYARAR